MMSAIVAHPQADPHANCFVLSSPLNPSLPPVAFGYLPNIVPVSCFNVGGCVQIEKAGGHSSGDGKGISGLDIKVEQHDQVLLSLAIFDFAVGLVSRQHTLLHCLGGSEIHCKSLQYTSIRHTLNNSQM